MIERNIAKNLNTLLHETLNRLILIRIHGGCEMYVCICKAVSEKCVSKAIECGCESFEAIVKETGVAQECGNCINNAKKLCGQMLMQARGQKELSQSYAA